MDYELAGRAFEFRQQWPAVYVLETKYCSAIYRPLILSEFESSAALVKAFPAAWINDFIVQKAVLYSFPEVSKLLTTAPAGLVDQLADLILQATKFTTKDFAADVRTARLEAQTIPETLQAFIKKAYPGIEGLKNKTYEELLRLFVFAESIIGQVPLEGKKKRKRHAPPVERADPEELIRKYPDILSPEVADKFAP